MSIRAANTPLVNHADAWRYRKGTSAPQNDWKTAADGALDSTWLVGNGGIGYADNTPETADCQTLLTDMKNSYSSLSMRRQFQITSAVDTNLHLVLSMDYDDGYIAFLDGNYLVSGNVSSAPAEPAYNALAPNNHESSHGNSAPVNPPEINDLGLVGTRLGIGTHTLAIVGLNVTSGSSDFIQVPDLYLAVVTNTPLSSNRIGGTITGNTTLYASNSPYTAISSVTIASGATLTIEPGTTLYLNSGVSISVANGGRIVAEGTTNAPILFTRPTPGASAWGGITINGGVGSPETRFAYLYFEGNGSTCIHVSGGTLYLDHCSFGTTTHQYVSLDNSSFLISACHFPSSTAGFELVHGTGGIKSGGQGIVRDCFFGTTTGYNDIMDFTGGNRDRGQPIIQYYNNVFTGGSDDQLDLDGTDAWIEGNIFLHCHRNGSPDSSSGISGGKDGSDTSQITIIGNIFYDCDQAAMAKEGNFFTLLNNTIVHQTGVGGQDAGLTAVVCLEDGGVAEGAGMYLEGNIIYDAEKLTRGVTNSIVTFTNNIICQLQGTPWSGRGGNNSTNNPLFSYVPQLSETFFTNCAQAQVMMDWFRLQAGSPGIGTGPNGRDKGALIPYGASLSGEPTGTTTNATARLIVGIDRTGNGIPTTGWPNGSGFTHYKWRLDTNQWSAETPIGNPIFLSNLPSGAHQVAVIGKNDAGDYQNDPVLGTNAVVTYSKTWDVQAPFEIISCTHSGDASTIRFPIAAGNTYTVQYKNSLTDLYWHSLSNVPAQPISGDYVVIDPAATGQSRIYRVVTPAQP